MNLCDNISCLGGWESLVWNPQWFRNLTLNWGILIKFRYFDHILSRLVRALSNIKLWKRMMQGSHHSMRWLAWILMWLCCWVVCVWCMRAHVFITSIICHETLYNLLISHLFVFLIDLVNKWGGEHYN